MNPLTAGIGLAGLKAAPLPPPAPMPGSRSLPESSAAPVIVGAGLAGSAAAIHLARQGVAPLLFERTPLPRPRLCGEFVSAEAAAGLAALGVDVRALGGLPTRGLRLSCGRTSLQATLPFEAFGLSRQTLDGALQASARAAGARFHGGQRVGVDQLAGAGRPFVLDLGEGLRLSAPTLLLACGKTELPGLARQPLRPPAPLIGLRWHLRLAPAAAQTLEGQVEVLLFDGGYAGLQPIEGGRVNLCLLIDRSRWAPALAALPFAAALADLLQDLQRECPPLAERLQGAQWEPVPPQSIFRVPYGYLHAASAADPPGLWRLGDQAAVIPSYTGDGMAIALHSAQLAADILLRGGSAAQYHRRLHSDLGAQIARARALYWLGRSSWGRGALLRVLRRWPGLLSFIAAMTRVPPSALRF